MTVADAPSTAVGTVGDVWASSAGFDDLLETVADLTWPLSVTTYGRMRHDPQLTAVVNAYTLPVRSAPWAVDPAGCRDEVAQLVADDLGLPILGTDMVPGAARRRGVRWEEHLRLALLKLTFGHMVFEERYDIIGGRARLAALGERMPQSISDIELNNDGTLRGIKQHAATAKLIDAGRLLWYVHDREGANWAGRSMLRPAFGPWLLKHETWRTHATSIRRFGMGVPNVEAPAGATPGQVLEAQKLASAMRVGDQSGVGLPPGFKLNLTGISGDVPDAMGFIRYLDSQMAQMALVSVLNLDSSPNGSRALGETFIDLLLTSLNSVGSDMAETATGLSVRMVDYNWGETEPAPRIVCGDVGSRPEVTAEAIAGLMGAGAIAADPALEAWVRDRWRLPQRDIADDEAVGNTYLYDLELGIVSKNERRAQVGLPPIDGGDVYVPMVPPLAEPLQPVAAGRGGRAVRAAASNGLRREPTAVEAAARTDFAAVQASWQSELDKLISAWAGVTKAQRAELRTQIAEAVDAGDLEALGGLTAGHTHGAGLLAAAMAAMAADAAAQQADEADAQGVTVDPATPDESKLAAYAVAVAAIMASALANAAGRDALRRYTDGATGDDVADAVDDHLGSLSGAFLAEQLGGAMSAAQNQGRIDTIAGGPDPEVLAASEVLDTNTCPSCAAIDGHVFDTLTEAEAAYAAGGFEGCDGGLRCRGILVAVYDATSVDQAA